MSKAGRRRRTPERRLDDREARKSVGFLQRLQREVAQEQALENPKSAKALGSVSPELARAMIQQDDRAKKFNEQP